MSNSAQLDVDNTRPYCDSDMASRDYRLAAILFSDIVGFSRLVQQDESNAIDLLQKYIFIVRSSVEAHNGRLVRSVGDTALCELPNSVHAVTAGIEIHRAIAEHNQSNSDSRLSVRIGVHVGDIYFVEGDAFGEGVTIAGRIQQNTRPGRIGLSQDVQNLVSGKIDIAAQPVGTVRVRGLDRVVPSFEIAVSPDAEYVPPGWQPEEEPERPSDDQTPSVESPSSAADQPSVSDRTAGSTGETSDDDQKAMMDIVKPLVLEEIKKAGRRLSIGEVRSRIGMEGTEVERALERLATKGFLVRAQAGHGTVEIATPGRTTLIDERGERTEKRAPATPRTPSVDSDSWDKWDEYRWKNDDKAESYEDGGWSNALSEQGPAPGAYDPVVEDYKDYVAQKAEKDKAGFRSHLTSFLSVNGGLIFLWAMTSGFGSFPWFLFPLMGWGIGLASHFSGVRQRVRESEELDGAPGLTREQLRIYRKLVKARGGWWGHLVSNIATSALLLMINLITSPGFPWSLFPVGFMAIGVLSHLPAFKANESRLLGRLKQLGAKIGGPFRRKGSRHIEQAAPATQLSGPSAEAENVRRRLVQYIDSMPESSPLGADFLPVLENYVEQIKLLDQKTREIDQIAADIPLTELERDLAQLRRERESASSDQMRAEYDKSISQIEKQQKSFAQFKNEREILRLRLNSGLNQLRQMEIDVARMRNLSSDEEIASVRMLRDKATELNTYLTDLQDGYREIEQSD